MATFKPLYASAATITITVNSLASAAARQSAVVDNSTNLYEDALVSLTVKTATGTLGSNPVVNVWLYALGDSGNYTDAATGLDAAYTMLTNPNLRLLDVIQINASATAYVSMARSVAALFGGRLPQKWGIIVENKTGLAMNAATNTSSFIGVNTQSV